MMKTIKIFLISTLLISIMPSCEDVLNRLPVDKIKAEDVFSNQTFAEAYVTNLYSRLVINDFMSQPHIYTDEATNSTNNSSNVTTGTGEQNQ